MAGHQFYTGNRFQQAIPALRTHRRLFWHVPRYFCARGHVCSILHTPDFAIRTLGNGENGGRPGQPGYFSKVSSGCPVPARAAGLSGGFRSVLPKPSAQNRLLSIHGRTSRSPFHPMFLIGVIRASLWLLLSLNSPCAPCPPWCLLTTGNWLLATA